MSRITWLTITAYNKCNPAQKKLMCEHYGNESEESVNKIIKLYQELEITKAYDETVNKLRKEICELTNDLPSEIIPHEVIYRSLALMEQNQATC